MPRVKAVFFDVDNTLFPTSKFAALARRNAVRAMVEAGLNYEEGLLFSKLNRVVHDYGANYNAHFNRLLETLGEPENPRAIAAGIVAYHNTKASLLPYPEVPRVLVSLKENGYKIYAFSEGTPIKQWDKIIRLGISFLLDDVFVCSEKKSSEYSKVLGKLKLKPSSCVMVGDRLEKDIKPAREAGMKTVRVMRGKYAAEEKDYRADYRVENLVGLQAVLKKMGGKRK